MAEPQEVHVRRDGGRSSGSIVSSHASAQVKPDSFPIMDNDPDYVSFKTRDNGQTEDQAITSLKRDKTLWAALLVLADANNMPPAAFVAAVRLKRRGL